MNPCHNCGGACCRYVTIMVGKTHDPDKKRWMRTRGKYNPHTGEWRIRCDCEHVTDAGRCAVYEDRPSVCKAFEVDGKQCRTVRELWHEEGGAMG